MATNPNLLTNPFGLQPVNPPPPTPPVESGLLPPTQPVQAPVATQPTQAPAPQPSQPQAPAPTQAPPAPVSTSSMTTNSQGLTAQQMGQQAVASSTQAPPTPIQPPPAGFQGVKFPDINEVKSMSPRDLDIYLQWVAGNGIGYDPSGYVGVLLSQAKAGNWGELATNIAARQREMQKFGLDRAKEYAQRVKEYVGTPQYAQAEQNWGAAARQALDQATKQWELAPASLRGEKPPTYDELIGKLAATNPYDQGGVAYKGPEAPAGTPAPSAAPAVPPASTIPFKEGLSDAQKASITTLSKKDPSTWTLTDKANWNYATNSAPLPNQAASPNGAAPGATPAASTSQTSSAAPSPNGQTSAIPFKDGLSDAQKQGITNLSKKPLDQWTSTDKANWAYATNGAPLPSSGAAASGVSSGASSPPGMAPGASQGAVEAPVEDFDAQFKALFDAYQKAQLAGPSTEEVGTQSALDKIIQEQANLEQAKRLGLQSASEQPIELGFITGQQANIERRATNLMTGLAAQEIPLKQRLAAEQAKRQAALDVADKQFELETKRLEKREAAAEAQRLARIKADAIKTLSPGQSLVDPDTGEVLYTAPAKQTEEKSTLQFVKATKYQPAGTYDTATGEFTPIGGVSAGGKLGTTMKSTNVKLPTGFATVTGRALDLLKRGVEDWGPVWNSVKAAYPNVPDDVIDVYLDKEQFGESGGAQEYKKASTSSSGRSL